METKTHKSRILSETSGPAFSRRRLGKTLGGIALVFAMAATPAAQAFNSTNWTFSPSGPIGSMALRHSSSQNDVVDRAQLVAEAAALGRMMEDKTKSDQQIRTLYATQRLNYDAFFMGSALSCRKDMMAEAPDKPLDFKEIKACGFESQRMKQMSVLGGMLSIPVLWLGGLGYMIWSDGRNPPQRSQKNRPPFPQSRKP